MAQQFLGEKNMKVVMIIFRFEVFTAVTKKNDVFWDVNAVWLL
jgi:hypothetical protein